MLVEITGKPKGLFARKQIYYLVSPTDNEVNEIISSLRDMNCNNIKLKYIMEDSQSTKVVNIKKTN